MAPGYSDMRAKDRELHIGRRIKKLRLAKGMTQAELAEKLDLTSGVISRLENEESMVGVYTLLGLSRALGVGIEEILPEYSLKEKYKDLYELIGCIPEGKKELLLEGLKKTLEAMKS